MSSYKLIALLLLGAGALLSVVMVQGQLGSHPTNSNCNGCHLSTDKAEHAEKLLASQEALCAGCHRDSMTISHPSGLRPSMKTPSSLPLDWKGDVTCSTCHDVHADGHGKMRVPQRGKAFCLMCHEQRFFDQMPDNGLSLVGSGHLAYRAAEFSQIVDPSSLQCMECHLDQANAPEAPQIQVDRVGIVRHADGRNNHPIGKRYDEAARFGGYRRRIALEGTILLPDGRLSCLSCHTGYSEKHGQLTIDNRGSRLCYECHDL